MLQAVFQLLKPHVEVSSQTTKKDSRVLKFALKEEEKRKKYLNEYNKKQCTGVNGNLP